MASIVSSSSSSNNNKLSVREQSALNALRDKSYVTRDKKNKIIYPEEDESEEERGENNSLIIDGYIKAYRKQKGEEEKRKEVVTTNEQGKYSGVQKNQKLNKEDKKFFMLLAENFNNGDKTKLPKNINIHNVVNHFMNKGYSRGSILVKLSMIYCYATGCLLLNKNQRETQIDDLKDVKIVTKGYQRAQIEHIIAWRLMRNIAAGLPESSKGFKDRLRDVVGSHIRNEDLMKTEEGKKELRMFESAVSKLGKDIIATTSLYPHINNDYFKTLIEEKPGTAMGLIINMERIRWHGMWYSIRLFNMIKSNMAIIKIEIRDKNQLVFTPSVSRIELIIDIMLLHVFKNKDELYENYNEYRQNQVNITENFKKLVKHQKDEENTAPNNIIYDTENVVNQKITQLKEFNVFKEDIIKVLMNKNKSKIDIKNHFLDNILQVTTYLCEQLNSYKYKRAKLLKEPIIKSNKNQGQDAKKVSNDIKKISKTIAGKPTPENQNTIDRTRTNRKTNNHAKRKVQYVSMSPGRKTGENSTNDKEGERRGNANNGRGLFQEALGNGQKGGKKRSRRRRKKKKKRSKRKKKRKRTKKKRRLKKKRTRRRKSK